MDQLLEAMGSLRGAAAADRLCALCVDLFGVDAAAVSLIVDGAHRGTVGVSSRAALLYDEQEFVLGQGPCLTSVADRAPVLVADLRTADPLAWPRYTPAMLELGVHAVHAVPVALSGEYVGAIELFRHRPGPLEAPQLSGAHVAAYLAQFPLLDLVTEDALPAPHGSDVTGRSQLSALSRIEVSRAAGMTMAQLDIDPESALVLLRAHAYATGASTGEVARAILERRLRLEM